MYKEKKNQKENENMNKLKIRQNKKNYGKCKKKKTCSSKRYLKKKIWEARKERNIKVKKMIRKGRSSDRQNFMNKCPWVLNRDVCL